MSAAAARTLRVGVPSWADFEDVPDTDVDADLRPPHVEMAELLRRYRAELDAAARSAEDARMQGLRGLAEQAVLAIELERLLDGRSDDARLRPLLLALKQRMLEQVERCGLEVVRLEGAAAADVAGVADIEHWRIGTRFSSAVVAEELEAAVRVHGRTLRKGRVVMGAPCEQPVDEAVRGAVGEGRQRPAPVLAAADASRAAGLVCPVEDCGMQNGPDAVACAGCLTPLSGYRRLVEYPRALFGRGLRAARAGDVEAARECFAAASLWLPDDPLTRNAYALACLDAGDLTGAAAAWEGVLAIAPDDALATGGLSAIARARDSRDSRDA